MIAVTAMSNMITMTAQESWWSSWPGVTALIVLIALIAIAAFATRRQLHRYRRRTHQLENLISARSLELAIANADLERLSITDPLTGLKNRRFLEFSITEDLARVRRSLQQLQSEQRDRSEEAPGISFLLIDIDHFKEVNDRYGHPSGDSVLRQVGIVFTRSVRESDTIIRWGGEEFLIVARNTSDNYCAVLAERIRRQMESAPFSINSRQTLRLTCSTGFASWPFFKHEPDALGWNELIDLIDRCLYTAKNRGRNTWIGASAHPDYKGPAHPGLVKNIVTAEAERIIRIQSPESFRDSTQDVPLTIDAFQAV
jgi:diguanylate cyclase (GGDEF)-like protein/PGF-CTERM protein